MLDIGNITFFLATLPQLKATIKNRHNLGALSGTTFALFIVATAMFIATGFLTGSIMTTVLGIANEIIFALQLYWKMRSKK